MPALCTDPHVRARLAYLQMADELVEIAEPSSRPRPRIPKGLRD
jgi:hypothetical protein